VLHACILETLLIRICHSYPIEAWRVSGPCVAQLRYCCLKTSSLDTQQSGTFQLYWFFQLR
jgi:hypothetical protein